MRLFDNIGPDGKGIPGPPPAPHRGYPERKSLAAPEVEVPTTRYGR
jgi:hypothetical protein